MSLENILSQEIVQKLGWTLLHFVWQATAIALLLAIVLAILRKSTANVRYIVACTALALMVLLPAVTMQLVPAPSPPPIANIGPTPAPIIAPVQPTYEMPLARVVESDEPVRPESMAIAPTAPWKLRAVKRLEPILPYIVIGWLLGVFGLSVWHLGGWAQLQRLRRKLTRPVDAALRATLKQLAGKLGVDRAVELLESALVQVPTVVGWLRPVILLPASALTGLSIDQLEALLAHELAHVRRYDYLVNMLQTVVETLGFYHPAVWWVSHKIRIERENCCDDMAVSITGNRLCYARALTSMEEIRSGRAELAVAASGGNLFARIRRLVAKDSPDSARTSWLPSVITILLIAIMAIPTTLALTANSEPQQAQEAVEPQEVDAGVAPEGATLTLAIVPNIDRSGREPSLTNEEYLRDLNSLAHDGPVAESIRGDGFQWSPVKGDLDRFKGLPLSTYKEQAYILLCAGARYVMVPKIEGRQLWGLEKVQAANMDGRPAISVQFDEKGADLLYKLTRANVGNHLAVVVDGQVLSAPRIETAIRRFATVTVDFSQQELLQLIENLQKGMLTTTDTENNIQREQLNEILEKFSDGTSAGKTDNNSKSVRESVENYITTALAGDDEKAAGYAFPGSAVAAQTKDTRELLQNQDIQIVAACIGEWNSLAISSVIQADHGRVGSVVFYLKKVVLDQKVHWLIDDIDVETLNTIGKQISYFLKNVPDAKTIIVKPDLTKPDTIPTGQAGEPVESSSSSESPQGQAPDPNGPAVAKSPATSGADKPQVQTVRVELSVVEVSPESKIDGETADEIKNLLGGKITLPADSRFVADLLREAATATAPVKDESAGDKQVTQEQFNKLFDLLTSRGYVKILMNPTLEVVEGQTAKILSSQKVPLERATLPPTQSDNKETKTEYVDLTDSIQIRANVLEDGNISLQVEATFHQGYMSQSDEKTPIINKLEISTQIRLSPGESGVIGGMMQPRSHTEPARDSESSQPPANELLCILTASITTPPANTKQIAQGDAFQVFKPRIIKLQNSDPAQMAGLLTALFAEEGGDGVNLRHVIFGEDAREKPDTAGPLSSHFTFEDVPGTSSIIVISNVPDAYEAVEQLVLEFDKQKMAVKDIKQVRQWMAGLSRFAQQVKESEAGLMGIGRAMRAYAKDHDGKYPPGAKPYELREYLNIEEYGQYECMAYGKTTRDPADTVIYYDAQLFEQGKGTNVLFNDGHVEFVGPERLDELNINKTQILIETRILEVTDDFLRENQLDANSVRTGEIRSAYPSADSASEPNSLPYCLIFDDLDVDLLLKAMGTLQGQQAKMLAAPQALALDGRPVTMKTVTKLPVPGPSEPNNASGKAEYKLQFAEVGTSIKITPDALPDSNNVHLDFKWELSQVRDFEQQVGPDGKKQNFPLIARDNIHTTATVPDGKTLLIGGKKVRRLVVTTTKRPLLGDLPLVGSLFRSESRLEETLNVLILVKPTIEPEKQAEVQAASKPKPPPLDPNDPLIRKLERRLERAAQ